MELRRRRNLWKRADAVLFSPLLICHCGKPFIKHQWKQESCSSKCSTIAMRRREVRKYHQKMEAKKREHINNSLGNIINKSKIL